MDISKYSHIQKNDIVKQISKLSKNEHIELFKLIYKSDTKYTINNNGVFINMNNISDSILEQVVELINFCIQNTDLLNKHESYINNEKIKFLNQDSIPVNTHIQVNNDLIQLI
jgi:hypothetical protein